MDHVLIQKCWKVLDIFWYTRIDKKAWGTLVALIRHVLPHTPVLEAFVYVRSIKGKLRVDAEEGLRLYFSWIENNPEHIDALMDTGDYIYL